MRPAKFYYALLLLASLALPASLFAQGQTFDSCDQWAAATCGNIVGEGQVATFPFDDGDIQDGFTVYPISPDPVIFKFEALEGDGWLLGYEQPEGTVIDNDGDGIDDGMPFASYFARPFDYQGESFPASIPFLAADPGGYEFVLRFDEASGPVNGFCLDYFKSVQADFQVSLYDGDLLLETFDVDAGQPTNSRLDFGYLNSEEFNITHVEFTFIPFDVDSGAPDQPFPIPLAALIFDVQIAFCEDLPPVEATCYDQLATLVAEIQAAADAADGRDARYYNAAAACAEYMQCEAFWDDDFDRLSRYGGSLFIGGAYTIAYLERVDDPQSDVLIDKLLDVLDCIVDREIDYAIDNGGEACLIERAEDFADLAEIIDEDFDNQVVATLAYKLAWLNAFYSTY